MRVSLLHCNWAQPAAQKIYQKKENNMSLINLSDSNIFWEEGMSTREIVNECVSYLTKTKAVKVEENLGCDPDGVSHCEACNEACPFFISKKDAEYMAGVLEKEYARALKTLDIGLFKAVELHFNNKKDIETLTLS